MKTSGRSDATKSDRLVADVDTTLMQQILDIPKRERKPDEEHHNEADDLAAGFEPLEGISFGHVMKLFSALALPQAGFL